MKNGKITRRQFFKAITAATAGALGYKADGNILAQRGTLFQSRNCEVLVSGQRYKPNVLLIVVDDLNNSLACYGHSVVKSPNIDLLAARGVRFERAYCQFPVCNPSRTSFLTGLRPDSTGILNNTIAFRSLLPHAVTLPQLFRQHGYFTARIGKVFHGGKDMDDPEAWDAISEPVGTSVGRKGQGRNLTGGRIKWCRWLAAEGNDEDQPDGQIAIEAIQLLQQLQSSRNISGFFLAVGFHRPHDPFIAPEHYFELYPLDDLEPPQVPPDRSEDLALAMGRNWKAEFDRFTDQERREFMRAYYACISFMDAQVGKIMAALDSLELWHNTIVVFLSDHGYHLGEHGWWNKNTLFEFSARAPLIVVTPELEIEGINCSQIVEFIDIYPTLAELCGLPMPANLEGMSLQPLLTDVNLPWKNMAFTQVQRGNRAGRSVRTDRWRYIEWDEGREGIELYDHDSDPGEYYNLAHYPQYTETIAELKNLLSRSMDKEGFETGDFGNWGR